MLSDSSIHSDELSRCLFNESNDAFFVVDPDSLIVSDVNPTARRITGSGRGELVGRSIHDLVVGDTTGAVDELIDSCRRTTFFHAHDGYQLQSAWGPKDVSVSLSRLHGETRTWCLVVLRDITARQELQRSLTRANQRYEQALAELKASRETITRQEQMRAIGHMASGVAHDLNNLLSPILNLSTVLLKDSTLADSARQQIGIIESSARDAAESVRRLQRYQFEESQPAASVSVAELILEIPEMTRPRWDNEQQIQGGPIDLDVSATDDLPCVNGAASELRQVLLNLVLNALDAMPSGGRLTVRARPETEGVCVEVSDTGHGMTPADQRRCLDAFYTTRPEGAGLGLSLSLGIIEGRGGRLNVESEPGAGTTVRFWLPASDAELPAPQPVPTPSSEVSVLWIEDDPIVLESMVVLLQTMDVEVTPAEGGAAGIELIESQPFDVVMTDVGMTPVSGCDVIRAARLSQPETPICALSGWSREQLKRHMETGTVPDRILTKPVEADQLQALLADVAAKRVTPNTSAF